MLGELAEHGLMVAKDLALRLRASEETGEAVALADAFQKVSRVVRLTLALDFKLDRDAACDEREARKAEAEAPAPRPRALAPARRTDPSLRRLDGLFWAESEGDTEEFERLWEEFDERMYEATLNPELKDLSIEALFERVIADMGLSGELTPGLCEPPPGDAPACQPEPADTG
jgi:hypothetical protein